MSYDCAISIKIIFQGTNRVSKPKHDVLRLRGGAGSEDGFSGDEDKGREDPPQKSSCLDNSSFLGVDLSAELLFSPELPAKQGVKRRSSSCDGRLQGCVFFHSTLLQPGHDLVNVRYNDDMDLNNKIIDIEKKRRQTVVVRRGKTKDVSSSAATMSLESENYQEDMDVDEGIDYDEKITAAGRGRKVGDGDDVSVDKEVVFEDSDGNIPEDNVANSNDVCIDLSVHNDAGQGVPIDENEVHDDVKTGKSGDYIDPYDIDNLDDLDDSIGDPPFEPPKKKVKRFDTVKIWSRIQASQSSKKAPPVTNQATRRTPPAEFKKRRDEGDEEHWRQLGGSTPDDKQTKKRPGLNLKVLEFLVHKEAKEKKIDLATTPLKAAFFDDLVSLYGDVEGANRLTPWTRSSATYLLKKWRQFFCSKTTSEKGNKLRGVHIYEPPQVDMKPCNLCDKQQTPDVRDTLLEHLMKSNSAGNAEPPSNLNKLVKCQYCGKSFKTTKTFNNHVKVKHPDEKAGELLAKSQKGIRSTCPHCNSNVANLVRHIREDCRMQPKNLVECPHCFAKILRLRINEHVHGRVNKVTGVVTKKGCIEKQNERVTRDGKEEKVAPLTRCEECGKNMTQKYLPEHKKLFHNKSKMLENELQMKDSAAPGLVTASKPHQESLPSKGVQSSSLSHEKQPEKDKETEKPAQRRANIFYTREQWVHAVNTANYNIGQENSKREAYLNRADMGQQGIQYLEQFAIRAVTPTRSSTGEPRFAPPDGDCIFTSAVIVENPDMSDEETKDAATNLRISTIGEALQLFPDLPAEKKEQLRQACSAITSPEAEAADPLTDEEVEALLSTYMQSGEYGDNMGDVLSYLLASRLRATLLIINVARASAFFMEPNIFNHERTNKQIYVLVHRGEHYEPLELPHESKALLEELYQTTLLDFKGQPQQTNQRKKQAITGRSQTANSSLRPDEGIRESQAVSGKSLSGLITNTSSSFGVTFSFDRKT